MNLRLDRLVIVVLRCYFDAHRLAALDHIDNRFYIDVE